MATPHSDHSQEGESIPLHPRDPPDHSTPMNTYEPPADDDPDQLTPKRTIDSSVMPKITLQQV